jgi:hypothetical protein
LPDRYIKRVGRSIAKRDLDHSGELGLATGFANGSTLLAVGDVAHSLREA